MMNSLQSASDTGPETWIALLGRQDKPTDGVEDYCVFLGAALAKSGIELRRVRVSWAEVGWRRALSHLRREAVAWRNKRVLLQYTALSWSERGFPFRLRAVIRALRTAGARTAIVFHEPQRQPSLRWIDRARGLSQDHVIRALYAQAERAIFTVPLDTVSWLPKTGRKAAFIPIGANVPQRLERRSVATSVEHLKTVIVFGVTGEPATEREVDEIAAVVGSAGKAIANLRLVVIGRGADQAHARLAKALEPCNVDLTVRGILPAEEVANELQRADALLFVRGPVTPRRGSALAGIACGVPIVGYKNGTITDPLTEAGVEWAPWGDRASLVQGLIRILSDDARWTELHERNTALQQSRLSWDRIAEQFRKVFAQ
jgi:glycosyltransferase involved in cell wall biosynthesis